MRQYGIGQELFNQIIHILPEENKVDYIQASTNDIFIDDSFAERDTMQKKYGVHSFSVDMIEVLIDWRM